MSWPDLASHFFKIVILVVALMAVDYAFLDGRNTRQAVVELERMAGDAPAEFNHLIRNAIKFN
jgi:hypothetical protein